MEKYLVDMTNGFKGYPQDGIGADGKLLYTEGNLTLEAFKQLDENKNKIFMVCDDVEYLKLVSEYENDLQKDFKEINEKEFNRIFNMLPPRKMKSRGGCFSFFAGEAYTDNIYSFYFETPDKRYFTALRHIKLKDVELIKQINEL